MTADPKVVSGSSATWGVWREHRPKFCSGDWYPFSGTPEQARALLQPLSHHLNDYGIGSIAEIFDGDPPFIPRGCIAQAWSVSETLRAWLEIGSQQPEQGAPRRAPRKPSRA